MCAPESKADLTIGAGSHTCRIPTHPFPSGGRLCNDDAQDSAAPADPSDDAASDQAIGLARHEEARGFLENRRRSDICDAGGRGAEPQRVMSFVPLHDNTTPIQTGLESVRSLIQEKRQQRCGLDVKRIGNAFNNLYGRIPVSGLDPAHIGGMQMCPISKLFL
eukprot:gene1841-2269_t